MSLIVDGTNIPNTGDIYYNGTKLTKVICNGVTVWEKQTIPDTITSGLGVSRVFIDEFAVTQNAPTSHVLAQNPILGSAQWKCNFFTNKYNLTMVREIRFDFYFYYHDNSAYNPSDSDSYPKKYFHNGAYFYFGVGNTYYNNTLVSFDPFSAGVCYRVGSGSYTPTFDGTGYTTSIALDVSSLTGEYYIGIAVRGINGATSGGGFDGYDIPALTDCWNQGGLDNWHSHFHTEQINASISIPTVAFAA